MTLLCGMPFNKITAWVHKCVHVLRSYIQSYPFFILKVSNIVNDQECKLHTYMLMYIAYLILQLPIKCFNYTQWIINYEPEIHANIFYSNTRSYETP